MGCFATSAMLGGVASVLSDDITGGLPGDPGCGREKISIP
jgi:hypothetical protein